MYSGRYEIKKYGRRNEYKSANGWGRWKLGDEIEGISKHGFADARWEKTEADADHVSVPGICRMHRWAFVVEG